MAVLHQVVVTFFWCGCSGRKIRIMISRPGGLSPGKTGPEFGRRNLPLDRLDGDAKTMLPAEIREAKCGMGLPVFWGCAVAPSAKKSDVSTACTAKWLWDIASSGTPQAPSCRNAFVFTFPTARRFSTSRDAGGSD